MQFRTTSRLTWKESPAWFRIICIVAIVNFASFMIIAVLSGGDALNGKEKDGRYYLMSHGHYTEVSKAFFEYSRIHTASLFITHPLVIFSGFWLLSRKKETFA
jgi:hypothetical protein